MTRIREGFKVKVWKSFIKSKIQLEFEYELHPTCIVSLKDRSDRSNMEKFQMECRHLHLYENVSLYCKISIIK